MPDEHPGAGAGVAVLEDRTPPPPPGRIANLRTRRPRRSWLPWLLITAGLAVAAAAAWSLWGTGLVEARAQSRLMREFRQQVQSVPAAGAPAAGATAPAPPEGSAVAVIKVPRLDLEKAVVEGVTAGALRNGPGHYPKTPLPGQAGNAAIAGHRTTYGAPFSRLDELVPGDAILVTTRAGSFRYEVTGSIVIRPSQRSVLAPTPDNRLTLTTCHPKFSARQRLVVTAALVGEPTP